MPDGDTNAEGNGIEELTLSLGLTQVISEPTNFEPYKNPSCIDLIFTGQPNIIMESGALCHHQNIFCRANLKLRVDQYNKECKLSDPNVSKTSYWKILTKIMNRCKAQKIPPILVNHCFVTDCKIKCNIFAKYFSEQCKLIVNSSVFPHISYLTNVRFNVVNITGELLSLLRAINPTKSSGPDEISDCMLLFCDVSLVRPLKLLFENILSTGIYPNFWKIANITPIFK